MTVEEIMSPRVVTVSQDDTLITISALLQKAHFHHLLVTEKGKLCGVISDRDLLKALSPFINTLAERPQDLETGHKRAHHIMSRKPFTAERHTTIDEAARSLLTHQISCLPVVDPNGIVEGIITWKDILRWHLEPKTA